MSLRNKAFNSFCTFVYLKTKTMLKKQVPNIITLLNLFSGCIAVIMAMQNNLVGAAIFVGLGIFFDFFDGLAARSLKVQSELGLQLDSLADMVTSGLVPGIVMFQLLKRAVNFETDIVKEWSGGSVLDVNFPWFATLGLLITLASAYRLAKFNIDERQTSSFIGLPTPANAILILSFPLILIYQPEPWLVELILNKWILLVITLLSCFMLNAEVPLFALKFKNFNLKENWFRFAFLIFAIVAIFLLKYLALPIIIITYVLLSVILNARLKKEEVE